MWFEIAITALLLLVGQILFGHLKSKPRAGEFCSNMFLVFAFLFLFRITLADFGFTFL
jgi:hypothetical protein